MSAQDRLEEQSWCEGPSAFWLHPRRWSGPINRASQKHEPFWMYLDRLEVEPQPPANEDTQEDPLPSERPGPSGILRSISKTQGADGEIAVVLRYDRGERILSLSDVEREYPFLSSWARVSKPRKQSAPTGSSGMDEHGRWIFPDAAVLPVHLEAYLAGKL